MTVENGEVVQAVVDFVADDGTHFQNKFTWECEFASGQTEANVLGEMLDSLGILYDQLAAEIPVELDDPDVFADVIEWVTDHWEVVRNIGEGVAGTSFSQAGDILPFQTSGVLVGRTERPRSRGRKFLPPFGEDRQASSVFISATLTALANALTQYLVTREISSGNDLIPGVASVVTGTFLPFVGGLVSDYVRTQRRRTPTLGI